MVVERAELASNSREKLSEFCVAGAKVAKGSDAVGWRSLELRSLKQTAVSDFDLCQHFSDFNQITDALPDNSMGISSEQVVSVWRELCCLDDRHGEVVCEVTVQGECADFL